EELDPAFSQAQLFDSQNRLIEPGPGEIAPSAPRVLRLILPDLPKGSYTALWRVRSIVDGHITEGSLPFGVGVAPTSTSLIPPLGAPDPATPSPPPLATLARWLNLVAVVLALGGLPFGLLVWRPAFRRASTDDRPPITEDSGDRGLAIGDQETSIPNRQSPIANRSLEVADDAITHFIRRTTALGGLLFVLTNLLFLITQAAEAANVPLAQAIGAPAIQLLSGQTGLLWLARLALMLQVVVLVWRLPPSGRGPAGMWWALLAIGGVIVLTLSLRSHAAASQAAAIAVPVDWLHLAATIAWLGGLIPLAFALSLARALDQAMPPALLIPRFSRLTIPCVAILTVTGIYNYVLHIGALELLPTTTYGRALLIKLGLFGVLLLLGGLNLFVLSRRLRSPTIEDGPFACPERSRRVHRQTADSFPDSSQVEPGLAGAFVRSVRGELVAGALLLLLVGAMTSVAPSKVAWQAHEQQGIAQSAQVGDVGLTLRVAPAQIGDNEFAVDVLDSRPNAQAAPTRVLLRFDMLGMDMGQIQTEARQAGAERYTARGSFTSMGGRWNVEVVLRRAGFDDVRHTFEVDIVRGAPFVIEQ
ncbi:MAG TPA: CopD family protein, partial [Roseiflexaceae bacterium]|nr:CopD family protein [Roseiflexaceae bacterium]